MAVFSRSRTYTPSSARVWEWTLIRSALSLRLPGIYGGFERFGARGAGDARTTTTGRVIALPSASSELGLDLPANRALGRIVVGEAIVEEGQADVRALQPRLVDRVGAGDGA